MFTNKFGGIQILIVDIFFIIISGATAHGSVTEDNYKAEWDDDDKFTSHLELKFGSFNNVSIADKAKKLYAKTTTEAGGQQQSNWATLASMLTDIRRICPLQDLAKTISDNSAAKVYSYVATQTRSKVNGIADSTVDIEAIFGTFNMDNEAKEQQEEFVNNMQDLFYTFVRSGEMPQNKDVTMGIYMVDGKEVSTQAEHPHCDFWKNSKGIVPQFAYLN